MTVAITITGTYVRQRGCANVCKIIGPDLRGGGIESSRPFLRVYCTKYGKIMSRDAVGRPS